MGEGEACMHVYVSMQSSRDSNSMSDSTCIHGIIYVVSSMHILVGLCMHACMCVCGIADIHMHE